MICIELIGNNTARDTTDLFKYRSLHSDGRKLISSWFDRAWARRTCQAEDSFEPFIFTWIAFNGWAACVTDRDEDKDWRRSLMLSNRLCDDFSQLIANKESPLFEYANEFHQLWPVFKAQAIRRAGISRRDRGSRQEIIEYYLEAGVRQSEPKCWARHREEGSVVPLDWPHTLAVLNRVRCNLFHGEKAIHSEMDSRIVVSAFRVLAHFLKQTDYIS